MRFLLALVLIAAAFSLNAQKRLFPETRIGKLIFDQTGDGEYSCRFTPQADTVSGARENPRLVAALLDISLGLFGVHRLYLGTDVKVPVFYTLTIGGGGLLWLIDLGLILFTKDLAPYLDNPHVFMWVQDE